MKNILLLMLVLLVASLSGCAVKKEWAATGGSRADATIKFSYSYNSNFEKPEADDQQALQIAIKRCKSWGYESAEPFDELIKTVASGSPERLVTKEFQCVGTGVGSAPAPVEPNK